MQISAAVRGEDRERKEFTTIDRVPRIQGVKRPPDVVNHHIPGPPDDSNPTRMGRAE